MQSISSSSAGVPGSNASDADGADDTRLFEFGIVEKNTFLHAEFPKPQLYRQTSAPASASGSIAGSQHSSSYHSKSAQKPQISASPGADQGKDMAASTSGMSESSALLARSEDSSEEGTTDSAAERRLSAPDDNDFLSKKCARPCKSQRVRYSKLMDLAAAGAARDPLGFDLSQLEMPAFLIENEKLLSKLQQSVEKFKAEALAGSSASGADRGSSSSACRGPAGPSDLRLAVPVKPAPAGSAASGVAATNTASSSSQGLAAPVRPGPLWKYESTAEQDQKGQKGTAAEQGTRASQRKGNAKVSL